MCIPAFSLRGDGGSLTQRTVTVKKNDLNLSYFFVTRMSNCRIRYIFLLLYYNIKIYTLLSIHLWDHFDEVFHYVVDFLDNGFWPINVRILFIIQHVILTDFFDTYFLVTFKYHASKANYKNFKCWTVILCTSRIIITIRD